MTLSEAINDADNTVDKIIQSIDSSSPHKHLIERKSLPDVLKMLGAAREGLELRKISFAELEALNEKSSDATSLVRILRVQAYFSATWSCYDQMTAASVRLCGTARVNERPNPTLLSTLFVDCDGKTGTCDNDFGFDLPKWLRENYGRPVCLHYKLRNLFLHEAGLLDGARLFEANSQPPEFYRMRLSTLNELDRLVTTTFKHTKVNDWHRFGDWPEEDDFLKLVSLLQSECDAALGSLLEAAVQGYSLHLKVIGSW